jgi:hypothetical protein
MSDFLLIFRNTPPAASDAAPSPEQLQARMKLWQDWIGSIAAQNKLVSAGNRLNGGGKVVKTDTLVTDGPYVELKEVVGGYSIVKAASLEEAAEISKGCPIFKFGGTVEVREIIPMD